MFNALQKPRKFVFNYDVGRQYKLCMDRFIRHDIFDDLGKFCVQLTEHSLGHSHKGKHSDLAVCNIVVVGVLLYGFDVVFLPGRLESLPKLVTLGGVSLGSCFSLPRLGICVPHCKNYGLSRKSDYLYSLLQLVITYTSAEFVCYANFDS